MSQLSPYYQRGSVRIFTTTVGQGWLTRDPRHPSFESDLKRDVAAINAVLDPEAAADDRYGNELGPLLRTLVPETLVDRRLINMIHFAKDEFQQLIHWRACQAHTNRLSCLDLRNPRKELDTLAMELNPTYALQATNRAAIGTALPPVNAAETRAISTNTIQRMLRDEELSGRGVTDTQDKTHTTTVNIPQLLELAPKASNSALLSPTLVRSPYETHARYVNPADYPSIPTPNMLSPQRKYVWSKGNTGNGVRHQPGSIRQTRQPVKPPTSSATTYIIPQPQQQQAPQADMLPKQGHMPNLAYNTGQKRMGPSIDRELFSPKRRATPGSVNSSLTYGLPLANMVSPNHYSSGRQQANMSASNLSKHAYAATESNSSQHGQPKNTQFQPAHQLTPAASPAMTHALLDLIVDPHGLYIKEQRQMASHSPTQQENIQQQLLPTRQPAAQQPLSLQALQSPNINPASHQQVNPEWEVWHRNKLKKEKEERIKAERKKSLRIEILAEIATGADILAYRYNEYLEVFPLPSGQFKSKYLRELLANENIADDDESEAARTVRFAKSRWWNYWTTKDRDSAMKAMKKATEDPLGLEGEMRKGGHLITQTDIGAIRRNAKAYTSPLVGA